MADGELKSNDASPRPDPTEPPHYPGTLRSGPYRHLRVCGAERGDAGERHRHPGGIPGGGGDLRPLYGPQVLPGGSPWAEDGPRHCRHLKTPDPGCRPRRGCLCLGISCCILRISATLLRPFVPISGTGRSRSSWGIACAWIINSEGTSTVHPQYPSISFL